MNTLKKFFQPTVNSRVFMELVQPLTSAHVIRDMEGQLVLKVKHRYLHKVYI